MQYNFANSWCENDVFCKKRKFFTKQLFISGWPYVHRAINSFLDRQTASEQQRVVSKKYLETLVGFSTIEFETVDQDEGPTTPHC